MSDLRSRLADALAEFFDRNNITVGTAHPALAAEALLSLPGIAIVDEIVWYITTDTFDRGGRVIAGPFPKLEDALRMRQTIESHSGRLTYWVDKRPWAAAAAAQAQEDQ